MNSFSTEMRGTVAILRIEGNALHEQWRDVEEEVSRLLCVGARRVVVDMENSSTPKILHVSLVVTIWLMVTFNGGHELILVRPPEEVIKFFAGEVFEEPFLAGKSCRIASSVEEAVSATAP